MLPLGLTLVGTPAAQKLSGRPIDRANDVAQPRTWLNECINSHQKCKQALHALHARRGVQMPPRLLEIHRAQTSTLYLKIRDTNGMPPLAYVALSYRWPEVTNITTKRNIGNRRAKLDLDDLCPLFQDVVSVTDDLDLRYIWIDALCIIQDDMSDRTQNIAGMADIFRNATLVVTASTTASLISGLFQARKQSNINSLPYNEEGQNRGQYFVSDRDFVGGESGGRHVSTFREDVTDGPLAQRAWCLQERVLSARILHFGKDQKHWECLSGMRDETSSSLQQWDWDPLTMVREIALSQHSFKVKPIEPKKRDAKMDELCERLTQLGVQNFARVFNSDKKEFGRPPYSTWYKLVKQFTGRQMMHQSDKLAAVAGVALAFSEYVEDRYVAGLWL